MSVGLAIDVGAAGPASAIVEGRLRLSCPPGVVDLGRHAVRWRRHRKQIRNHDFVESNERVMNLPSPLWRPVPVNKVAGWRATVPIPFDGLPELRNPPVEILLGLCLAVEVLPGGEKPLHQERRFHQVSTVVEHAKYWHGFSRASVYVMGPGSVIALRVFQEADDPGEALNSFFSRDE